MYTLQKFTLSLTVFFSVLLVACAPTIPPSPTSLPVPVQISKTSEPAHTATPATTSPTPRPQQLTAAAQLTQESSTLTLATATVKAETNLTTTLEATSELEAFREALEAIREPYEIWESTSPNGKWEVNWIKQYCADVGDERITYQQIMITSNDNSNTWIPFEEIADCGPAYDLVSPIGWSKNSHYFYFTLLDIPYGCGFMKGGDPVWQLDTNAQQKNFLMLAAHESISPDQNTLALVSNDELVFWNMDSSEYMRTMINAAGKGMQVIWEPEEQSVIVSVIETETCELPTSTSIIQVDFPEMKQIPLILADSNLYYASKWLDTGLILLGTYTYGLMSTYLLNPLTGEIVPQQ